ncbi:hypothetical protein HY630_00595 [Candidatus Uhrbacteria bacterium]|nr:hypothetical protein [Candidatus Uhrbacteria bacterium]
MKKFSLFLVLLLGTASPALAADTTGPEVGTVSPLSAVYNVPQTYSVTATDSSGVESCTLVVSSIYETPMAYNEDTDQWEVEYTFDTERSANSIRARCEDTLGNETSGKSRIVSVAGAPMESTDGEGDVTPIETSEVDATDWSSAEVVAASPVLIKTVCPGGEDFTHPCRTVYFLDNEGYRHAFPNEKVYFTWYADYTDLHLVSSETMSSFSLGRNITYHPGTKLVKYQTVRTVYAVERYSVLRPIASEATAIDLYGENWNQQIDDISEAFYANYSYGEIIDEESDFYVAAQTASVDSINDNL